MNDLAADLSAELRAAGRAAAAPAPAGSRCPPSRSSSRRCTGRGRRSPPPSAGAGVVLRGGPWQVDVLL